MIHLFNKFFLTEYDYSDATDLIFSYRNGEFSICLMVKGYKNLVKAIGIDNVPRIFKDNPNEEIKYGVDLESLSTNKKRFYTTESTWKDVDSEAYRVSHQSITGRGYYINNNDRIWTTKIYKNNIEDRISIDRWKQMGTKNIKAASDEPEIVAEDSDWKGPKEILKICQDNGIDYRVYKKGLKNQSYVRVLINPQSQK